MELRQLRYFIRVAEELNFTRAAAKLHIAQPALSRQIRQLEEELGVLLLERTRQGNFLTPAGSEFLAAARGLVEQSERAVQAAQNSGRGERGRLDIGYVWGLFHSVAPAVLSHFHLRFPEAAVNLLEQTATRQAEALVQGKLDFGFIGFAHEADAAGLEKQQLGTCAFVAALPENHPAARKKRVPLGDLAQDFFFAISEANYPGAAQFILGTCREAGFRPKILQSAERGFAILSLVAGNCGVALLPESLQALPHPGVVFRPLRENPRADLFIAWNRSRPCALRREFLDSVGQVCGEPGIVSAPRQI